MDTSQALTIIQNIINAGMQKGLFVSMDDAATATIAFKTIEQALSEPKPTLTPEAKEIINRKELPVNGQS